MFRVRIQKSSHLRVHSEKDKSCSYLIIISVLFDEIVKHSGKSPSTISRHLRRLCADGIIAVVYGEYNIYRIIDKKLANQMLHKYKESIAFILRFSHEEALCYSCSCSCWKVIRIESENNQAGLDSWRRLRLPFESSILRKYRI